MSRVQYSMLGEMHPPTEEGGRDLFRLPPSLGGEIPQVGSLNAVLRQTKGRIFSLSSLLQRSIPLSTFEMQAKKEMGREPRKELELSPGRN